MSANVSFGFGLSQYASSGNCAFIEQIILFAAKNCEGEGMDCKLSLLGDWDVVHLPSVTGLLFSTLGGFVSVADLGVVVDLGVVAGLGVVADLGGVAVVGLDLTALLGDWSVLVVPSS